MSPENEKSSPGRRATGKSYAVASPCFASASISLPPAEVEERRADLAASYQRAIVRALVERIEASGADRVAVVGGVAANSELRASLPDAALAPLPLCTDNAAMIASAARYTDPDPYPEYLSLDARATA